MAIEVEIPIYADEPPHFLLWAVDEIMRFCSVWASAS